LISSDEGLDYTPLKGVKETWQVREASVMRVAQEDGIDAQQGAGDRWHSEAVYIPMFGAHRRQNENKKEQEENSLQMKSSSVSPSHEHFIPFPHFNSS
jgi:hypothetical protein